MPDDTNTYPVTPQQLWDAAVEYRKAQAEVTAAQARCKAARLAYNAILYGVEP